MIVGKLGIERIEVYSVKLRYHEPFKIAPGTSTESNNVVVRILTDYGVEGWGESSPSMRVTGETRDTAIEVISKIAPRLIGMCPLRIEQDVELMDQIIDGNPAAKAAIDIALHDILGKTTGKQLFMLIGGYRTEVLTDITLGIKSPREMAWDAIRAVEHGFKALKVKVGVNPGEDIDRIKSIREAVGDEIQLRIDANQGWDLEQAIEVLNKLEKFKVQFAEQPIPADDVRDLAKIRRNSPIPIMADESIHSPADALRLIKEEAVDLVNIKLMKSGGILKARKIAGICEAAGIPCMIGCMGESQIAIAAGTHLAAGLKNIQYADLDSDLFHKDKLVIKGGTGVRDSMRIFSKKSGLGIEELDQSLLGKPLMVFK